MRRYNFKSFGTDVSSSADIRRIVSGSQAATQTQFSEKRNSIRTLPILLGEQLVNVDLSALGNFKLNLDIKPSPMPLSLKASAL